MSHIFLQGSVPFCLFMAAVFVQLLYELCLLVKPFFQHDVLLDEAFDPAPYFLCFWEILNMVFFSCCHCLELGCRAYMGWFTLPYHATVRLLGSMSRSKLSI